MTSTGPSTVEEQLRSLAVELGDEDAVRSAASTFLRLLPERVLAIVGGDRDVAHALSGSAGMLGLTRLRDLVDAVADVEAGVDQAAVAALRAGAAESAARVSRYLGEEPPSIR